MTLTITQAKAKLSELVYRAVYGHERIMIGTRGRPKAAIISLEDLELFENLEDAQAIREGLAEHERGELIPWEKAKAQLHQGEPVGVQD
jgi:prevent-host-death family protein